MKRAFPSEDLTVPLLNPDDGGLSEHDIPMEPLNLLSDSIVLGDGHVDSSARMASSEHSADQTDAVQDAHFPGSFLHDSPHQSDAGYQFNQIPLPLEPRSITSSVPLTKGKVSLSTFY